jgi:tetratricopeptide (TPR) repeat protein
MLTPEAAIERHHAELARAGAAAMQRHYQEAIDVCSDLLTGDVYMAIGEKDAEMARAASAETRLIMATAMHYAESHYEDIVRVLNAALDSPPTVQKDVYFTLAVLHASFDRDELARAAMEKALALLHSQKVSADAAERKLLEEKEREAQQFLKELGRPHPAEEI